MGDPILLCMVRLLPASADPELGFGVSRVAKSEGQSLEESADDGKHASSSRPLREADRVAFNHQMAFGRHKWDFFVWF